VERAIVTVKRYQETQVRDLDIPIELRSVQLAEVVANALRWDQDQSGTSVKFNIEVYPPGRMLNEQETLASAGVVDGAWLTFVPKGVSIKDQKGQSPANPPKSQTPETPVASWRSLEINNQVEGGEFDQSTASAEDQEDNPFVWKEIDI